jgi:nucleoside 2-deoxyribosyltransferase
VVEGLKMAKIYIAGPIAGVPDFEERFAAAEHEIAELGHTVINPAVMPLGLRSADYMRISLAELEAADAVALLPGWALSGGTQIEVLYALYAGKRLFAYLWDAEERAGFLRQLEEELARNAISLPLGGLTEKRPRINDEQAKLFNERPFVLPSKAEGGTRCGQWPPLREDGGPGDCRGMVPMDLAGFREGGDQRE